MISYGQSHSTVEMLGYLSIHTSTLHRHKAPIIRCFLVHRHQVYTQHIYCTCTILLVWSIPRHHPQGGNKNKTINNLHELHHHPPLHPSLSLSVSPPSYLIVSIVFFIIIKASSIFNDCLSSRAKPIGEKLTSLQCSKYEQPNH